MCRKASGTAFAAGGCDYVTKPIKPKEVMARMQVHLQSARERRQTRNALDAFGYATITVRVSDGCLMWQTPLARELLERYCGTQAPVTPEPVAGAAPVAVALEAVMAAVRARSAASEFRRPGKNASSRSRRC